MKNIIYVIAVVYKGFGHHKLGSFHNYRAAAFTFNPGALSIIESEPKKIPEFLAEEFFKTIFSGEKVTLKSIMDLEIALHYPYQELKSSDFEKFKKESLNDEAELKAALRILHARIAKGKIALK